MRTRCGHAFCEECALRRHGRTSKCAVCEKPTMGIFNVAEDIVKKYKLEDKGATQGAGATTTAKAGDAGGGGWSVD